MSSHKRFDQDEDRIMHCDSCGRQFSSFELVKSGKHWYCEDCLEEIEESKSERELKNKQKKNNRSKEKNE